MKPILFIMSFVCFALVVVFGGEYLYDLNNSKKNQITKTEDSISNTSLDKKLESNISTVNSSNKNNSNNKSSLAHILQTTPKTLKVSNNTQNIIDETPPYFSAGFDWRLANNAQTKPNSGFIGEDNDTSKHVKNSFIIVKWDETNPQQGRYDFRTLDAQLRRIAPRRALIRLEVNSSCEAPKWALNQLRETKDKSLIYWDKNYQDLSGAYINAFAKNFAGNPQIIGVQLGLADGEFGSTPGSCNNYSNKDGWGEFWMSPSERQEAEQQFGFNPEVFTQATIANIDIYANAFGQHKNKLAFTNIGTLFTYGEGAEPYNKNLKKIAQYALNKGIGNRDGAVERWMSYTDKVYGTAFKTMPDGSCLMDVDENYMRRIEGRYWGTENEFYGNKGFVIAEMGPVRNHPYIFLISSLRTLQMRRNFMSITNMNSINDPDYKTQDFMKYLSLTLGKNIDDTSDAFVLMGERYIVPYRLADQMDAACVRQNTSKVTVRSFGRWLTESPQNIHVENAAAIKVTMPASENHWYQKFYLPEGIDYEYFARKAKTFGFDVNDKLSATRCKPVCDVEVKAVFKDTVKTKLFIEVAEGRGRSIQTQGDNRIKTVSFKIRSQFKNKISGFFQNSDIVLNSENQAIPLILMRMNLLN